MKKEIKKENQDGQNPSKIYRLEEMTDAIGKSIDNAEKVKNEQEYLVNKLEGLNDEKFVELIKSMKEQIKNMDKQITVLNNRKSLLVDVIGRCKDSEECKIVVDNLLSGLGVFDN